MTIAGVAVIGALNAFVDMHAERQKDLYEGIWSKDPSYGTKLYDVRDTIAHRIRPHLERLQMSSFLDRLYVVDFGAGDGRFLRELTEDTNWKAFGIDLYKPPGVGSGYAIKWLQQPMWKPLSQLFDYAISTDALEHLPTEMVVPTLINIAASAAHGFLRVSLTEDHYGTERGLHLHETVWPAHIWRMHMAGAGIKTSSYRVYLDDKGKERALEVWF